MSRGPQYVFLILLRLTVSAVRPVLSLFLAALGSLPARWADDPGPEASSYFRLPSLFFCFAGGVQPRGLPAHFSGMQSYCENTGWGLSCAPVLVLLSFSTSCLQVGWIRVPYHESAKALHHVSCGGAVVTSLLSHAGAKDYVKDPAAGVLVSETSARYQFCCWDVGRRTGW